jgi:tetratricopeptide (TPR) repeat protein
MREGRKKVIYIIVAVALILFLAGFLILQKRIEEQKLTNQLELGDKALVEELYEKAITHYEEVINIDAENVDGFMGVANVYLAQEKYEEAVPVIQTALSVDDKNEDLYIQLADVYVEMELYEDAIEILEDASEHLESGELTDKIETMNNAVVEISSEPKTNIIYQEDGSYCIQYIVNDAVEKAEFYTENDLLRFINNDKGEEIKSFFYDENGILYEYMEYEYYEDSNLKKRVYYDADGVLLSYDVWEYLENGGLKLTEYFEEGIKYSMTEFDENMITLRHETYYADGSINMVQIYEDGEYVEFIEYNMNGDIICREDRN